MQIDVQALDFQLTPALREHTERRLRFALGWAESRLVRLVVRLSDLNGPRGGVDKRCQLHLKLTAAPPIVIEDTETDLYAAINRAADRAGRTVARRLDRSRNLRSRPRPLVTVITTPDFYR
jgi:ribosomal subunit interface protein